MFNGLLALLGVLVFIFTKTTAISSCGGYIKTSKQSSGVIQTPNFPSYYDNNGHCIWLLEGGKSHDVILTMYGFQGEWSSELTCADYVEVREGSSSSRLLYKACDTSDVKTIRGHWLWVRFFSNTHNVSTGFNATWHSSETKTTSSNQTKSPIVGCPWTRYSCANHECISWSWVCDGINDCGCTAGCDEDSCHGFGLSAHSTLILGICTGATIFVLVIVTIVVWERHAKYRAKKDDETRRKEAERMKRQKHVERTYNSVRSKGVPPSTPRLALEQRTNVPLASIADEVQSDGPHTAENSVRAQPIQNSSTGRSDVGQVETDDTQSRQDTARSAHLTGSKSVPEMLRKRHGTDQQLVDSASSKSNNIDETPQSDSKVKVNPPKNTPKPDVTKHVHKSPTHTRAQAKLKDATDRDYIPHNHEIVRPDVTALTLSESPGDKGHEMYRRTKSDGDECSDKPHVTHFAKVSTHGSRRPSAESCPDVQRDVERGCVDEHPTQVLPPNGSHGNRRRPRNRGGRRRRSSEKSTNSRSSGKASTDTDVNSVQESDVTTQAETL